MPLEISRVLNHRIRADAQSELDDIKDRWRVSSVEDLAYLLDDLTADLKRAMALGTTIAAGQSD